MLQKIEKNNREEEGISINDPTSNSYTVFITIITVKQQEYYRLLKVIVFHSFG